MTVLQQAVANAATLRPAEPAWQQHAPLLAHFLEQAIHLTGRELTAPCIRTVLRETARVERVLEDAVAVVRATHPLKQWHTYCWRPLDPKARRLISQTLRIGALMRQEDQHVPCPPPPSHRRPGLPSRRGGRALVLPVGAPRLHP